ncbi:MAG: ABC transporter ATP-binding protein [Bacillota bacterium]|nr:ABC transporter ATP-binding protein [Bacillota bacterium]
MIAQLKRLTGFGNPMKLLPTLCIYSVLVVGAQLILFFAFQILGTYTEAFDFNRYVMLLGMLIFIGTLNYSLGYLMDIVQASSIIRWKLSCKKKLIDTLLSSVYHEYEQQNNGHWLNLVTNDTDGYFDQLKELAGCIVMLPAGIIMLVLSMRINSPLTLVTLSMGALQFFIREWFNRNLANVLRNWKDEQARNTQSILGVFRATASSRWQNTQSILLDSFQKANSDLRNSELRRDDMQGAILVLNQVMIYLSDLIFFLVAVVQIAQGNIMMGGVLSIYAVRQTFSTPFEFILPLRTSLMQLRVLGQRLEEGLDVQTYDDDPNNLINLSKQPELEFKHVSFQYHEGSSIIAALTNKLPFGKHVHIRGKSGAGKTTLFQLLTRLYEPTSGKIIISGIDYKYINHTQIREMVAYVPQDFTIFTDTIKNNISLGKPNATMQEIMNAAKKAHIHEFVLSLPEGYQTILQDFGHNLSAGQRQRVAVARALLRDAPILLLDEISAMVDPQIRMEIYVTICNEYKRRTLLLISHQYDKLPYSDMAVDL